MTRIVLSIIFLVFTLFSFAQDDHGVKKIVVFNGEDTLLIKRFDNDTNLIFEKSFPTYSISMMRTWKYSNNKLQTFTWVHSNVGFIESEYEYDSFNNIVNVYSYRLKDHKVPENLMMFHSEISLKKSLEFKSYISEGERYLKSQKYYKDSLLVKELIYTRSVIADTVEYLYNDLGLLTNRKTISGKTDGYDEVFYKYDSVGNELGWRKIYNGKTESFVEYIMSYEKDRLIKQEGYDNGKLKSIEKYNYLNGKLSSKIVYNENGVEKIKTKYFYRSDGRIDHTDNVNKYRKEKGRTYYFY